MAGERGHSARGPRLARLWACALCAALALWGNGIFLATDAYRLLAADYRERAPEAAIAVLRNRPLQAWGALSGDWIDTYIGHNPWEARSQVERALAERPADARLWSRYSVLLLALDEQAAGVAAARHALRLAPQSFHVALEQSALASGYARTPPTDLEHAWRKAAAGAARARPKAVRAYLETVGADAFCARLPATETGPAWCGDLKRARPDVLDGRR